jgi:hypothetical protein
MEMNSQEREQYLALVRAAAVKINPATAQVFCEKGWVLDPYRIFKHGDDWEDCYGAHNHFARSPGSDVWVWFGDLPDDTRKALRERMEREPEDDDALDFLFGA